MENICTIKKLFKDTRFFVAKIHMEESKISRSRVPIFIIQFMEEAVLHSPNILQTMRGCMLQVQIRAHHLMATTRKAMITL